jgi:hypothetical protein
MLLPTGTSFLPPRNSTLWHWLLAPSLGIHDQSAGIWAALTPGAGGCASACAALATHCCIQPDFKDCKKKQKGTQAGALLDLDALDHLLQLMFVLVLH